MNTFQKIKSIRLVRSSCNSDDVWSIWEETVFDGEPKPVYELYAGGFVGSVYDIPVVPIEKILNLK